MLLKSPTLLRGATLFYDVCKILDRIAVAFCVEQSSRDMQIFLHGLGCVLSDNWRIDWALRLIGLFRISVGNPDPDRTGPLLRHAEIHKRSWRQSSLE